MEDDKFYSLQIQKFNGLQGTNGPGFSWLVFSGNFEDPEEPLAASSNNYTLTGADKDKVSEINYPMVLYM